MSRKNRRIYQLIICVLFAGVSGCGPFSDPRAEYLRESQILESLREEHAAVSKEADKLEFEIERGHRLVDELELSGGKEDAERSRVSLRESEVILRGYWNKAAVLGRQIQAQEKRTDAAKRKLGL
jgi:hypothetical protein